MAQHIIDIGFDIESLKKQQDEIYDCLKSISDIAKKYNEENKNLTITLSINVDIKINSTK